MSETTEVNRTAFGQFLNQLRREKGWTQKDLAERLYVSDKAVSKWERGLSLPDVALLLPLAGALGVSVTELLEGRRAVQEQRYSAAEVEALIRKALAFPVEPPERQQARMKRYLPVYLICCVLGVAEALAVWMLGLAPTEMGQTCLVLGVGFGVIYGAYAFFWMAETLPRYTTKTALRSLHRGPCTSTSRASTTTTATGGMCCGPSGPGPWHPCCCCRPLWRWRGSWTRTWAARRPLQHLQCTS